MKEISIKCIYCKKDSTKSGLMQMTIYAPGTYVQCFDIRKDGKQKYCPENKEFVKPDGSKEVFEA